MVTNMIPQAGQHGFGLVLPFVGRERVASMRVLPATDWSSVVTADVPAVFRGTAVCGYSHITDVTVKGAFPGTSAWSPPT